MTGAHEKLLEEVIAYAEFLGCSAGAAAAYHDILPECEKARMAFDYSPAALAVRLRADRRIWHPSGISFIPVDAKTSTWHVDFPVEALQIGFHVLDNDGCLLAMRSHGRRNEDRGIILTRENVAKVIKQIRIPDFFTRNGIECHRRRIENAPGFPNVRDDAEYYENEFSRMFPGVRVCVVSHTSGSGDPYAIFDREVFESLPDWREVISDWASNT